MSSRRLTERMFTSAGWKRQHGDKDMLSNWRSPPRPGAKSPEKVGRITGDTGKSAEDERVAAGSGVVRKRSNVRGAKGALPFAMSPM